MLHLREADVERLLQPRELTNTLEQAFSDVAQGRASFQPRLRVVQDKHVLHNLPAISPGLGFASIKSYLTGPGGMTSVVLLFELESNKLVATIEASRLGQLRTGCATALAARHLAPEGDLTLGLIGTGTVARGQLEALAAEFDDRLKSVRVFSRKAESRDELVTWAWEKLQIEVVACDSADAISEGANLVVTATGAARPVLHELKAANGLLCAVGSNWPQRSEVAPPLVLRCAEHWVDDVEQARREAGDLVQTPGFDWNKLRSLAQLVGHRGPRRSETDWVFFKSLGLGIEDLAAAVLVYRSASGS